MPLILRPPGFRSGLANSLAAFGRTRRRTSFASGLLTGIALITGIVLAICSLDTAIHLHPLLRAVLLILTLVTVIIQLKRGPIAALKLPVDPCRVALDLEEHLPILNDSLGSAVSFLHSSASPDRTGPGDQLRAAAIRAAEREIDRHNLNRLIPSARLWRATWICGVMVAIAAPLVIWDLSRASIAIIRFADPFGIHPWPAKTRIELVAPQPVPHRMPKGESFEMRFIVSGEIPSHAEVTFRLDNGSEFSESYPLVELDSQLPAATPPTLQKVISSGRSQLPREAHVTARIRGDLIPHDFEFRIRANDADTGWLKVFVANPPKLVPIDGRASPQLFVTPPEYTGLQPYDDIDDAKAIVIPFGSTVRLRALADTQLSSASVIYLGKVPGFGIEQSDDATSSETPRRSLDDVVPEHPIQISPDGRTLDTTLAPVQSGLYALQFTDESGITGLRPLRIRVDLDRAPVVILHRPMAGKDPPVLVTSARLTTRLTVEDRLYAFKRIEWVYRVGKDGRLRSIPIMDVERAADHMIPVAGPVGILRPFPTRYEDESTFVVAQLLRDDGTPVREGDEIDLWVIADDWDNVTPGKSSGKSEAFHFTIVSRAGAEAYVVEQLTPLRKHLAQTRAIQQDARRKILELNPSNDGQLTTAERESLLSIESMQQQVRTHVLTMRSQVERLRETICINGLDASPIGSRVELLSDNLGRLAERDLVAIGPKLAEGRALTTKPIRNDDISVAVETLGLPSQLSNAFSRARGFELRRILNDVERSQYEIEAELSLLMDVMSDWGHAGAIRSEALSLREAILRESSLAEQLPMRIPPGRAPSSLSPEQRDELVRAVTRLDSLVERAHQLVIHTKRLAEEKERTASDARARAEAKEAEFKEIAVRMEGLPEDSPQRTMLKQRAEQLATEANLLRLEAQRAATEATALRQALSDADESQDDVENRHRLFMSAGGGPCIVAFSQRPGSGLIIVRELQDARKELDINRPGHAVQLERSAASRLDRMAAALTERATESLPEQSQRLKLAADELDQLAAEQFDLDRRIAQAARLPESERTEVLKALAREQQRLVEQGKNTIQRLTRSRLDSAARDVRDAVDLMQSARDDLHEGKLPVTASRAAVEKLDDARDQLDQTRANAQRQQLAERKRQIIARLMALREAQQRVADDTAGIHLRAVQAKGWDRDQLRDYSDLIERERVLAEECRRVALDFHEYPVLSRLLEDSSDNMWLASHRIAIRLNAIIDTETGSERNPTIELTIDAHVHRPMTVAVRRLETILTALQDEPELPRDARYFVSPIAQAKTLRTLQAELNQRTLVFDKAHPDRGRLDEYARAELKEIEDLQRALAELFTRKSVIDLFAPMTPTPPQVKP